MLSPSSSTLPYSYHFFFFNDPATTAIYTLSLHDALPISAPGASSQPARARAAREGSRANDPPAKRSEEHTSELQSPYDLVCRLLLEKKKQNFRPINYILSPYSVATPPKISADLCPCTTTT